MRSRRAIREPGGIFSLVASRQPLIRAGMLALALAMGGLAGGCASPGESPIPDAIPNGTLTLGAVMHALTRAEIMNGWDSPASGVSVPPTHKRLLDLGYGDRDLVDGSVVVVGYQIYRHGARGATRGIWEVALVPKGLVAAEQSVVEVEAREGFALIARVRQSDIRTGDCQLVRGERGALGILDAISPTGGPRTGNFTCPGLESEGWVKVPSGYVGGYVWRKYPKPLPSR